MHSTTPPRDLAFLVGAELTGDRSMWRAEDSLQELALLARRGVERFYLQFSDFATPETLERFGAEVIPAVTGAGAR